MISLLYRLADFARDLRRARCATPEQAHGRHGEDLAHRFLRRQGLTIVARNFRQRSGSGELDIVARDGEVLVFVEVNVGVLVLVGVGVKVTTPVWGTIWMAFTKAEPCDAGPNPILM